MEPFDCGAPVQSREFGGFLKMHYLVHLLNYQNCIFLVLACLFGPFHHKMSAVYEQFNEEKVVDILSLPCLVLPCRFCVLSSLLRVVLSCIILRCGVVLPFVVLCCVVLCCVLSRLVLSCNCLVFYCWSCDCLVIVL